VPGPACRCLLADIGSKPHPQQLCWASLTCPATCSLGKVINNPETLCVIHIHHCCEQCHTHWSHPGLTKTATRLRMQFPMKVIWFKV
jgi:hypothetical protein